MPLKHGLLGLLNYSPMSGYELNRIFEDSLSFFWSAKTSQIYRELDAMEQRGWLKSKRVIQTEKPNKRVYSLTDAGREEFMTWLSKPEPDIAEAMRAKSAFLMRVFFAGEAGAGEALALIRSYRETCLITIEGFDAVTEIIATYAKRIGSETKALYWRLTVMYGTERYKADVAWADQAIAILEKELAKEERI